jgi:hypothetical protein
MFAKSPENVRIISFSCKNASESGAASQNVVLLIADIEAHATSSQLLAVDSKATMPFAPAVVGDVSRCFFFVTAGVSLLVNS